MSSLDNEEYIDYNNIYVDNSWIRRKFYKKYYYYNDNDNRTYRFLEWKQTKDNTWDWYITEEIDESSSFESSSLSTVIDAYLDEKSYDEI